MPFSEARPRAQELELGPGVFEGKAGRRLCKMPNAEKPHVPGLTGASNRQGLWKGGRVAQHPWGAGGVRGGMGVKGLGPLL